MVDRWRRGLLFVVASLCLAAGAASAQDPRASSAQRAARDWLALTDRGDAQASWQGSGKKFQSAMSPAGWAQALSGVRPPLGQVLDRALTSTEFTKSFPGVPDGDYVLLIFRSSFAKKAEGHETVTLEREADGNWRVIGYFIR